jgi:hypothetical protein
LALWVKQQKKDFVFPNDSIKKKDIRIIKWDGGHHYYAKIKDFDIVDEKGNQKWFTEKEAYDAALNFIKRKKMEIK